MNVLESSGITGRVLGLSLTFRLKSRTPAIVIVSSAVVNTGNKFDFCVGSDFN